MLTIDHLFTLVLYYPIFTSTPYTLEGGGGLQRSVKLQTYMSLRFVRRLEHPDKAHMIAGRMVKLHTDNTRGQDVTQRGECLEPTAKGKGGGRYNSSI